VGVLSRMRKVFGGGEVEMPAPKPRQMQGAHSVEHYGGYIRHDEQDPSLQGHEKWRTYSQNLANVSVLAAGVRQFLTLVSASEWSSVPADESPQAQDYADLAQELVMNSPATSWPRIVRRAAMFRFMGFSIQEWQAYRREDGRIGLRDVAPRAQRTIERWGIADDGEITGVVQRSPQTGEEVSIPRGNSCIWSTIR
jgi:hypothetical protein